MDSGDSQYAPEANGRLFLTALVSSLTGNVSIGFMHATPGDMKSLRSSADRIDKTHGRYEDGYSIRYGFGRVNAEAAVSSAQRRKGARKRRAGKKR